MHRILGDLDTYTPLISDPKVEYRKELEVLVQRGFEQGILNKKEKLYLVLKAPRTPVIYYLPKIHKHPTCPPGTPQLLVTLILSHPGWAGMLISFSSHW